MHRFAAVNKCSPVEHCLTRININSRPYLQEVLQNHVTADIIMQTRQTQPGLVAFYDIRPGNGVGLFLQPQSLHGAFLRGVCLANRMGLRAPCIAGSAGTVVMPSIIGFLV